MDQKLEKIRDQQQQRWNQVAAGWDKWERYTSGLLGTTNEAMIRKLELKAGDRVLDIATGTGEPALSIAARIGEGRVTMTDLSENMLAVAVKNAGLRNISNIEAIACDVSYLPFADASFDAISCRMGLMFFPDLSLAAAEMYRVLRPGGLLVVSVWEARAFNDWVGFAMDTISAYTTPAAPDPHAPGLFRCSLPGSVSGLLQQAGFTHCEEESVRGLFTMENAETYWAFHSEVAAPLKALLEKTEPETRSAIRQEVIRVLNQKFGEGLLELSYGVRVIAAKK